MKRIHCTLLAVLTTLACDIAEKDIGQEADSGANARPSKPTTDAGHSSDSPADDEPANDEPTNDQPADDGRCTPGETTAQDCNTCTCSAQRTWSCTEIACGGAGYAGRCDEPGSTAELAGCSDCTCGDDYLWECEPSSCPGISEGDSPFETDAFVQCKAGFVPWQRINRAELNGNILRISIANSGCSMLTAGGCWDGMFLETEPTRVSIAVVSSPDDQAGECDAYFEQERELDLTPIIDAHVDAYGETAQFVFELENFGDLTYTF